MTRDDQGRPDTGVPLRGPGPADMDGRALLAGLPVPATLLDGCGTIAEVNPAFIAMASAKGLRVRREDRVGFPLWAFAATPESGQRLRAFVSLVLEGQGPQRLRWAWATQGRPTYTDVRAAAIRDAAGQVCGAVVLWEDVTEETWRQRRADGLGRVRDALWRMSSSGDLSEVLQVLLHELRSLCPQVDACSVQCLDRHSTQWVSYQVSAQQTYCSTRSAAPAAVEAAYGEQRPVYRPDLEANDPFGEAQELRLQQSAYVAPVRAVLDVPLEQGTLAVNSSRPHAFSEADIAVVQDMARVVSEGLSRAADLRLLEHTHRELTASGDRYQHLMDRVPLAIVATTPDGRVLFYNHRALEILAYTSAQMAAGAAQHVYADPADRQELVARARAEGHHSYEYRLKRGDGALIWIRGTTYLIAGSDGSDVLLTIADDVTERRQLEQEVAQAQRLRAVADLAAGISHNLNNILVAVLGPAQLLQRLTDDPQVLREAEQIEAGARRARDLVSRLSQAVRNQPLTSLDAVELHPVIEEAVSSTQPQWRDQARARGVCIQVVTELEGHTVIRGRRGDLSDVVVNLLLNAVDALPQGGTITVRTHASEDWVRVSVADTGVGMDAETQERLFQPFFTTKRNVGSGLGLALVRGIVSRWGGRIWVDSAVGAGSTFTVELPLWRGGAEPA